MAYPHYPVNRNGYLIVQQMSNGDSSSSIIYKAICSDHNSVVAVNVFNRDLTEQSMENTDLCYWQIGCLSHTNLLKPHCSFRVDEKIWVVMPFMSHGSLHSILSSSFPNGLPEKYISAILKRTLHALSFLHTATFVHGDINPRNIFFDSNGCVQLAYLGESVAHYQEKHLNTMPYWIAPEDMNLTVTERFASDKATSDIWSFGITALELVHGRPVPHSLNPADGITEKNFSEAFKDLVRSCLAQEPSKRLDAIALLDHPFFNNSLSSDFRLQHMLENKDDEGTSETRRIK